MLYDNTVGDPIKNKISCVLSLLILLNVMLCYLLCLVCLNDYSFHMNVDATLFLHSQLGNVQDCNRFKLSCTRII
jgi:hypothetical protein